MLNFIFNNMILSIKSGFFFIVSEIVFSFFILGFILWLLWLKCYSGIVFKSYIFEKVLWILFLYIPFLCMNTNMFEANLVFNCTFLMDFYSIILKLAIVFSSIFLILFMKSSKSYTFYKNDLMNFSVLWLLATFFMVSLCNVFDLILFYMLLEGLSLALYVLSGLFVKQTKRGTEASMKYFVLGLLASGFFSFGMSLIFLSMGETSFFYMKSVFFMVEFQESLFIYVGLLSLLFGFLFKLSAAPGHMWAPDIYEGVATSVTAFLAMTVKLSMFSVFLRILLSVFFDLFYIWQPLLMMSSVLSLTMGCFGALKQQKLKSLLAYASMNQMGYIFMGLACGTIEGVQSALIFFFLYLLMLLMFFGLFLNMQLSCFVGSMAYISELNGLHSNDPTCSLILFIVLLSMSGMPPLGGFITKYYLFVATIHSDLFVLTLFSLMMSIMGSFYYLRLVRSMIFENSSSVKNFQLTCTPVVKALLFFFSFYLVSWLPILFSLEAWFSFVNFFTFFDLKVAYSAIEKLVPPFIFSVVPSMLFDASFENQMLFQKM